MQQIRVIYNEVIMTGANAYKVTHKKQYKALSMQCANYRNTSQNVLLGGRKMQEGNALRNNSAISGWEGYGRASFCICYDEYVLVSA